MRPTAAHWAAWAGLALGQYCKRWHSNQTVPFINIARNGTKIFVSTFVNVSEKEEHLEILVVGGQFKTVYDYSLGHYV